jgi:hypothetical protein
MPRRRPCCAFSPLAEGADRLVAEEALKTGYSLFSPLPFPQAEYEKDFPASVEVFRALLARGETLELDGDRDGFAEEGYLEVGRFVLRNCDLLIAVWDGVRKRARGGGGDIVARAAQMRLPVWLIDAKGEKPPRLIEGPEDLRGALAEKQDAKQRLSARLEQIILPPISAPRDHHGAFGFLAHRLGGWLGRKTDPLLVYLAETPKKGKRTLGAVHSAGLKFQGMSASMSLLGHRSTIRSRVCWAQA